MLGDVAAVADVEDDDVVAVLGHEAHAAVRHSPATSVMVRGSEVKTLLGCIFMVANPTYRMSSALRSLVNLAIHLRVWSVRE